MQLYYKLGCKIISVTEFKQLITDYEPTEEVSFTQVIIASLRLKTLVK